MNTLVTKEYCPELGRILHEGGIVSVPTETVYGLAVNAMDEKAVRHLYEIKGRPEVKPLSIMITGADKMKLYGTDIPEEASVLAEAFWPGPLTLIVMANDRIPEVVRAGGTTIGIRCPDQKQTLELLKMTDLPLAAPSANPSGKTSPLSAEEVLAYFDGKIDAVLNGGVCTLGVESTIYDLSRKPYRILRQGALACNEIAKVMRNNMRIIGITGGSGCGKTTALHTLEQIGAGIIDCDGLYHDMLENDISLIQDISQAFPDAVSENGTVNRKVLGSIVFHDQSSLARLNEITHGHIKRNVEEIILQCALEGKRIAAIDAIALIESGISSECETTIGVLADRESRIHRIMMRDGISREAALDRINAQQQDEYYIKNCSHILWNDDTQQHFEKRCAELFSEVLS